MATTFSKATSRKANSLPTGYAAILKEVVALLEDARRGAVRTVNAIMTATYWQIGWQMVELEQAGKGRAGYGEYLLRLFYLAYPMAHISETVSRKLVPEKSETVSRKFELLDPTKRFPLVLVALCFDVL